MRIIIIINLLIVEEMKAKILLLTIIETKTGAMKFDYK